MQSRFEYFDWTQRQPVDLLKKAFQQRMARLQKCTHSFSEAEMKAIMYPLNEIWRRQRNLREEVTPTTARLRGGSFNRSGDIW